MKSMILYNPELDCKPQWIWQHHAWYHPIWSPAIGKDDDHPLLTCFDYNAWQYDPKRPPSSACSRELGLARYGGCFDTRDAPRRLWNFAPSERRKHRSSPWSKDKPCSVLYCSPNTPRRNSGESRRNSEPVNVPRPLTAPLDRRKMGKSGNHLQSAVARSWNGLIEGALTMEQVSTPKRLKA